MRRTVLAVVATTLLCGCGAARSVVRLQPEELVTLHVGQLAAIEVLSERHYGMGFAGSSLMLLKQTQQRDTTTYLYRAIGVGRQTFVATPRDPGPDGCISCVTVHYFINVVE